jgi:tetratricopeptide (TPR) repeat protein
MRRKPKKRGLGRHLDGWQAGAIVLLSAGGAFALALPRPVAPDLPPAPAVDGRALAATHAADDALARSAEESELPFDVRALGTAVRDYNLAAARGAADDLAAARSRIPDATRAALLSAGDAPVLALRAWQARRFVEELRAWERTGVVGEELDALGGDFVRSAGRHHWCVAGERRLIASDAVLRVLFKRRWNDVTGLGEGPFALGLEEERARFAFLLQHPLRDEASPDGGRQAHRVRLALVDRLEEIDPSYPADFARGAALFGLGRYVQAAEAFRRHLAAHPDGPQTLRAQNHLRAALELAESSLW